MTNTQDYQFYTANTLLMWEFVFDMSDRLDAVLT